MLDKVSHSKWNEKHRHRQNAIRLRLWLLFRKADWTQIKWIESNWSVHNLLEHLKFLIGHATSINYVLIIAVASLFRSTLDRWMHSTTSLCVVFPVSSANSLRSMVRFRRFWICVAFLIIQFFYISNSCYHSIVYFVWSYQELHQCMHCQSALFYRLSVSLCTHTLMHSNSEIYVINHKIHWLFQTIDIAGYSDTFNSIFLSIWFRFHSFTMPLSILQQLIWAE